MVNAREMMVSVREGEEERKGGFQCEEQRNGEKYEIQIEMHGNKYEGKRNVEKSGVKGEGEEIGMARREKMRWSGEGREIEMKGEIMGIIKEPKRTKEDKGGRRGRTIGGEKWRGEGEGREKC